MKYLFAVLSCIILFVVYACICSLFGWRHGGGAIPMGIFFASLIYTPAYIIKHMK